MSKAELSEAARAAILADPQAVLEDDTLLAALIAADEAARGPNVIDLRGIAMQRMADRMDRLEDTHRSVIAAAYDSITGTRQVHRAVLGLLEAGSFEGFLNDLAGPVRGGLRVDALRLVLESPAGDSEGHGLDKLNHVLQVVPESFVQGYMGGDQTVILRALPEGVEALYAVPPGALSSEACMRLDLGAGRLPAMLAMAAADPGHFTPQHGTDLMEFFGKVLERVLQHWLRQA